MTSVEEALERPCIADNSVMSNFVQAGAADLLSALLNAPVRLSPTVLDPHEAVQNPQDWKGLVPSSELLGQLRHALEAEEQAASSGSVPSSLVHYREISDRILDFAGRRGETWESIEPSVEELALAARLSSRAIREEAKARCPELRGRIELDAGEAEAVAIAVTRGWTILVDDQAAVNLLRCLYPRVPILRTCELLVHSVGSGLVTCPEASKLFNETIVEELGFYVYRAGQRLHLRCNPARCDWDHL